MKEAPPAPRYEPIALSTESTVVAEYLPDAAGVADAGYQSEADSEKAFIRQLQAQACEYLAVTSEAGLVANLRLQLEKLNKVSLSHAEWELFLHQLHRQRQ